MYAIVEIAGQQFKVAKDQKVYVHRLQEEEGSKISFNKVYLLDDSNKVTIGAPAITGASIEAKVLRHLKGNKVIVFKKKRRKGYRVKNGHRQSLTEILIQNISEKGSSKKSVPQKAKATEKIVEAKIQEKETKKSLSSEKNDLTNKTVAELKKLAKDKGITGISSMKKADLIAVLNN